MLPTTANEPTDMIHKIGLLLLQDTRVLLCRKRHTTSRLILPGGRLEPGESALTCLHREIAEELGAHVQLTDLALLGRYRHIAAADDPTARVPLVIDLYRGELHGEPRPRAEIRELIWFGPGDDAAELAPSLRETIFPDLVRRGVLPWPNSP